MLKTKYGQVIIALCAVVVIIVLWMTTTVTPNNLLYEVNKTSLVPLLETKYLYLILHAFTVIPVFLLSFDKRVSYYQNWKQLFPSIIIIGLVFILWDVYFTKIGVWGFNEDYFLSIKFLYLPIEEWLFFITVPFACVFIYECLNHYIKKDLLSTVEPLLTKALIAIFFIIGILCWEKMYTATTFIAAAFFLLFHYLYVHKPYRSRFYLAFVVCLIPFFLVNGVLTGGYTQNPIVIYNPEEYLGVRMGSIPMDDAIYNFILLLGVITLYELFGTKNSSSSIK